MHYRFALSRCHVRISGQPQRRVAYVTPQEALEIAGKTPIQFLRRHISADWGELSEEDVRENEQSLKEGFRLLSAYRTAKGQSL